jgi:hypothetical protein
MKENAIRELVILPVQIGSTDLECMMLIGNRLDELTLEKAEFHQDIMNQLIDILVPRFIEAMPSKSIHKNRQLLSKGFMYCFDKAVEDIYNLRARPTANVNFDLNDILTGESGDEIPEYIQLKVNPNIGAIATVYHKVVDHIEKIEQELLEVGLNYEDFIKCIFYGGTLLGTEFCLRIDLENSDEMDTLLND